MALHELSGEGLWFGASLRPWQILHSRLARMHTCSLLERDVWELMDETVEAASPDLTRYQCNQEEVQLMRLVGDDGELWRHGGLMEARIRDWLTSKMEEEARQFEATLATFSTGSSEANLAGSYSLIGYEEDTDQAEEGNHSCYYDGSSIPNTVARYSNDQFRGPFDSTLEVPLDQAAICGQAALRAVDYGVQQTDGDVFYDHAVEYHDESEEDTQRYIGTNNNMATFEAPLEYTAETRYSCQFSDDMVMQASTDQDDDQMEDEELCAVCLENVIDRDDQYDDQGTRQALITINSITRLPCCHSFHSHCLGPWLSASSRCPCCRAVINLSIARNEEAAPNVGIGASSGNRSDIVQRDMMGLLAEMEAALDRFGLLS